MLEDSLWEATDQFCANSGLKAQEYSGSILRLIFPRFAALRKELEAEGASSRRGSRVDNPAAYHAQSVIYLGPEARFDRPRPTTWAAESTPPCARRRRIT